MNKIFRFANVGFAAAVIGFGALAGVAQDPCADADGQTALGEKVRTQFTDRSLQGRKAFIETGKQFLEKYGKCAPSKELADWLTGALPKAEASVKTMEEGAAKDALIKRFNLGLQGKNWDEVYAAGRELVNRWPDEYRGVVLALGSIGLDETAKTPKVTRWNDDTLRYARQAIADLDANRDFKPSFGVAPFVYKNKEDALGWMHYTIGYILFFDKGDKQQGLNHLYRATQFNSETKSNPVVYAAIGSHYLDQVKRLAEEVTALEKKQDPNSAPEAQAALVEEIKAKVAMVNGTAEAALDAYARAHALAKANPTMYKKDYTDGLYKTMQGLYNVRFGKTDGMDAFIARLTAKPMPNPLNPVTPISDPEPAKVGTVNIAEPSTNATAAASRPTTPSEPAAAKTIAPKTAAAKTPAPAKGKAPARKPATRKGQ
jgi:tetratricopeptide (TPR) repeat protein